jgi:hypothetical protein
VLEGGADTASGRPAVICDVEAGEMLGVRVGDHERSATVDQAPRQHGMRDDDVAQDPEIDAPCRTLKR